MKRMGMVLLSVICLFTAVSCGNPQKTEVVREWTSYEEVASVCGFDPIQVSFEDYKISARRTVYDIVAETEFVSDNDKKAVLRMVSTEYTVTDLSGFADTGLEDVYTYDDGREFEIETRDGVYAVEWQDRYKGKDYRFSLVLFHGELVEIRRMLKAVLSSCEVG